MLKVVMLLDNEFTTDGRVIREAKAIAAAGHDLTLFAIKANGLPDEAEWKGIHIRRIFTTAVTRFREKKYMQRMAEQIAKQEMQVLHCHDHHMFHLGVLVKKLRPDVKLIYDSHELFHAWPLNLTKEMSMWLKLKSWLVRKLEIRRERFNASYIDYLVTVNQSLSDILGKYFAVKIPPTIVRNISERQLPEGQASVLRDKFRIPAHHKIIVHIAAHLFWESKNLDMIFNQLGNLDDISLVFICTKNRYSEEVEKQARLRGLKNIYFHPAIPQKEVTKFLSSADIGIVTTWNKKNLSYWYALDNKIFNYIAAHIPILATAQPEYANIIVTNQIGVCVDADQPEAFRNGLKELLANYDRFKQNIKAASEILHWDIEKEKLLDLYRTIESGIASHR